MTRTLGAGGLCRGTTRGSVRPRHGVEAQWPSSDLLDRRKWVRFPPTPQRAGSSQGATWFRSPCRAGRYRHPAPYVPIVYARLGHHPLTVGNAGSTPRGDATAPFLLVGWSVFHIDCGTVRIRQASRGNAPRASVVIARG